MGGSRKKCCRNFADNEGDRVDCEDNHDPIGPGADHVYDFLKDENVWLDSFRTAWNHATENGHDNLKTLSEFKFPSDYFVCSRDVVATTVSMSTTVYQTIADAVIAHFDSFQETVGDNNNPRAHYAGCLVRLVGHDLMDFRTDGTTSTGGSDGCINF